MDLATTYKIFAIKTLKEKRYYWARNLFFVFFPLLFIIVYIFSGDTDNVAASHNKSARTYQSITEVNIFHTQTINRFAILITFPTSVCRKSCSVICHQPSITKFTSCLIRPFIWTLWKDFVLNMKLSTNVLLDLKTRAISGMRLKISELGHSL